MKKNPIEKKTRDVYHDIHKKQGDNKGIFNRLTQLMNPNYLKEKMIFLKVKYVWMQGVVPMRVQLIAC